MALAFIHTGDLHRTPNLRPPYYTPFQPVLLEAVGGEEAEAVQRGFCTLGMIITAKAPFEPGTGAAKLRHFLSRRRG